MERHYFKDPCINGMVILKWILGLLVVIGLESTPKSYQIMNLTKSN